MSHHNEICDDCAYNMGCEYTLAGKVEDCDIVRDYETNMAEHEADLKLEISEETYVEKAEAERKRTGVVRKVRPPDRSEGSPRQRLDRPGVVRPVQQEDVRLERATGLLRSLRMSVRETLGGDNG